MLTDYVQDILDSFADLYGDLVSREQAQHDDKSSSHVWVTYTPPWDLGCLEKPDSTFTVLERPNVLSASGSTGHRTWEAALHLASALREPRMLEHVEGQTVLELGCGTGLLSILCSYLGARYALATDGDVGVVERALENIKKNKLGHYSVDKGWMFKNKQNDKLKQKAIAADVFEWGTDIHELLHRHGLGLGVDTVIAADVVSCVLVSEN